MLKAMRLLGCLMKEFPKTETDKKPTTYKHGSYTHESSTTDKMVKGVKYLKSNSHKKGVAK